MMPGFALEDDLPERPASIGQAAGVLREHLPNLGEGKDGFAPPF